ERSSSSRATLVDVGDADCRPMGADPSGNCPPPAGPAGSGHYHHAPTLICITEHCAPSLSELLNRHFGQALPQLAIDWDDSLARAHFFLQCAPDHQRNCGAGRKIEPLDTRLPIDARCDLE